MNNLEISFFDQANEDLYSEYDHFDYSYKGKEDWETYQYYRNLYGDNSVQREIEECWKEYEEYWEDRYFELSEDECYWWGDDDDYEYWDDLWDDESWDIDELEDYIHLCEICGIHVETETTEDVLAVWKDMEQFWIWNGTPEDDYEEELLAEADVEEKPIRTRADRWKNAFKAKARRVEILKNKGFSPEYEYCEKWLRQGKKMSEIRSKKSKDNVKSYRQARRARRNPNLSGKGNAYRRTTRGWYD